MASQLETMFCMVCYQPLDSDDARPRCGHAYCRNCIETAFQWAIQDESNYPVWCVDHNLHLEHAEHLLSQSTTDQFKKRRVEYNDGNKLYCSVNTCSAYISYDNRNRETGLATCAECNAQTCLECKNKAHEGGCHGIVSTDDERLIQLADHKKWRKCSRCQQMIERTEGCPHMTCVCGHQFCYICGGDYPLCHCGAHDIFGERARLARRFEGEFAHLRAGIFDEIIQEETPFQDEFAHVHVNLFDESIAEGDEMPELDPLGDVMRRELRELQRVFRRRMQELLDAAMMNGARAPELGL